VTPIHYRTEQPDDLDHILNLVDLAFGPGRKAKTAERLREHNQVLTNLSFVALQSGHIVGSVRMWPVVIGEVPAVFLGPIAVEDKLRSQGIGQELVERACNAASLAGWSSVLLVGDAPYFGRLGFSAELAQDVRLPGPVDQKRVLIKPLEDQIAPLAGLVSIK
jgi:predicted N-acetyltransferase YhbS